MQQIAGINSLGFKDLLAPTLTTFETRLYVDFSFLLNLKYIALFNFCTFSTIALCLYFIVF